MSDQQLRVWHIPQVPMQRFFVPVSGPEEAAKILNTLWDYDLFQLQNNIKPDYCNASGLEVYEDGEWLEWMDEDDQDILEWMRDQEAEKP